MLERFVRFYESWDAAEWRAKLVEPAVDTPKRQDAETP